VTFDRSPNDNQPRRRGRGESAALTLSRWRTLKVSAPTPPPCRDAIFNAIHDNAFVPSSRLFSSTLIEWYWLCSRHEILGLSKLFETHQSRLRRGSRPRRCWSHPSRPTPPKRWSRPRGRSLLPLLQSAINFGNECKFMYCMYCNLIITLVLTFVRMPED
jgi:hypothetical protein